MVAVVLAAACVLDSSGQGGGSSAGTSTTAPSTPESSEGVGVTSSTSRGTSSADGSTSSASDATSSTSRGPGSSSSSASSSSTSDDDSTTGAVLPSPCDLEDPELVACYDFEGVSGGTLVDGTGNGNDGTAVGVTEVPGPFGTAATFDANSELLVPDNTSMDFNGPTTLETWIYMDALPPAGTRQGLLDNEGQYAMTVHSSDQYRCSIGYNELYQGPVVLGEWVHLGCVCDAGELRIYLNGAQINAQQNGCGNGNPGLTDPTAIGDTSPLFDEPFGGAIGGLRVWSTARSTEQMCEAAGPLCAGA